MGWWDSSWEGQRWGNARTKLDITAITNGRHGSVAAATRWLRVVKCGVAFVGLLHTHSHCLHSTEWEMLRVAFWSGMGRGGCSRGLLTKPMEEGSREQLVALLVSKFRSPYGNWNRVKSAPCLKQPDTWAKQMRPTFPHPFFSPPRPILILYLPAYLIS